jgi:hypothetical protein
MAVFKSSPVSTGLERGGATEGAWQDTEHRETRVNSALYVPVFRIRIHLIQIRIQNFRLNTDTVPDPAFLWPKI